jgi:hypothetical protein
MNDDGLRDELRDELLADPLEALLLGASEIEIARGGGRWREGARRSDGHLTTAPAGRLLAWRSAGGVGGGADGAAGPAVGRALGGGAAGAGAGRPGTAREEEAP